MCQNLTTRDKNGQFSEVLYLSRIYSWRLFLWTAAISSSNSNRVLKKLFCMFHRLINIVYKQTNKFTTTVSGYEDLK